MLTTQILVVTALVWWIIPLSLQPYSSPTSILLSLGPSRGSTAPLASGPVAWKRQEEGEEEEFTLLAPTVQWLRLAEMTHQWPSPGWATSAAAVSRLEEWLPPLAFQAQGY